MIDFLLEKCYYFIIANKQHTYYRRLKMKYVYSDSLNEMVIKGFKMRMKNGEYTHYTWNDADCLYWNDDRDDKYYMSVPQNAIID